jgi:WS/DGAT/MGAT family acyltransferase
MRSYLLDKGELPEQSLVAMIPISTRTPEQAGTGGNQVSMVRAPLHTDIADHVERLRAISQITRRVKEQNRDVSARMLTEVSENFPGRLLGAAQRATMGFAARRGMAMGSNTTVTNIPGPQHPLYFAGAKLIRNFGAGPVVNGGGLIHPIGSYCGEMSFLFTACREMLPDPEFYADCIERAFTELDKATA